MNFIQFDIESFSSESDSAYSGDSWYSFSDTPDQFQHLIVLSDQIHDRVLDFQENGGTNTNEAIGIVRDIQSLMSQLRNIEIRNIEIDEAIYFLVQYNNFMYGLDNQLTTRIQQEMDFNLIQPLRRPQRRSFQREATSHDEGHANDIEFVIQNLEQDRELQMSQDLETIMEEE